MQPAYAKTMEFLAKTANSAAAHALLPGLDSQNRDVQISALQALLDRRDPVGQKAILDRLEAQRPGWDEVLDLKHGRLNQALRDAVVGSDAEACARACQAIVRYREYDLVPVLISAAESVTEESSETASTAIVELAQKLYEDLNGPRDYADRRDPQFIRRTVVSHLEKSTEKYPEHQSKEIIQAFLLLADRANVVLQAVLYDPRHPCYLPIVDTLANAHHLGIDRLLLDFLDSNQAPAVVLSTIAQRNDRNFMRRFITRWRDHPTPAMRSNVKRIEGFVWADLQAGALSDLDEPDQVAVLSLLVESGLKREKALAIVQFFLESGAIKARHAALQALDDFHGPKADALISKCLQDDDADVVVHAISQARKRDIPGTVPQLIALAENSDPVIQQAIRESLPEFHFETYWAGFEFMEESSRRSIGKIVKRVDPTHLERLQDELCSIRRSRRIRAAAIADVMGVAPQVESHLIEFMHDDDELVREAVAQTLGGCHSTAARQALEQGMSDRSPAVRNAAQASLKRMQTHSKSKRQGPSEIAPPGSKLKSSPAPVVDC
ncbi:MAG: HEAT repeat domain-containing protein [Pirellulales bacterium]|nr:HEAT repeat domain-containing protein [Pirellulales bacterium]